MKALAFAVSADRGGSIRLIPGILAILACVAIACSSIGAYVTQTRSADPREFVFVTIFLIFWCLPMTAVLLQVGSDAVATRPSEQARGMMLRIAETSLVSCAGFFVAYGLWIGALTLARTALPSFELVLDSALILIFAVNAYACAVRVRAGPDPERGSRWMTVILLAVTALVTSHTIAIASAQHDLAPFAAPALVWIAVLSWSARRWRRSRRLARMEVRGRSGSVELPPG